jgi:thiopeptide-type bacteriocin biosynthesis protein
MPAVAASEEPLEWLYYQLFPGGLPKMDTLIRQLVGTAGRMAMEQGADRWFFIRYLDERGPHVRFRARGRRGSIDALQRRLDVLFRAGIPEVARSRGTGPPTLVRLPFPQPEVNNHTGFVTRIYEPEWDKYGGAVGVDLAEIVFQVSSQVALEVLELTADDAVARAAVALALMRCAARRTIPPAHERAFWDRYFWHWSGGERARAETVRSWVMRASQRGADHFLPASSTMLADVRFRPLIERYADVLQTTFGDGHAHQALLVAPDELLFHHTHMTNNRLGLTAIEEAFLAGVLLQIADETSPAAAE